MEIRSGFFARGREFGGPGCDQLKLMLPQAGSGMVDK